MLEEEDEAERKETRAAVEQFFQVALDRYISICTFLPQYWNIIFTMITVNTNTVLCATLQSSSGHHMDITLIVA